jgi:D-serine dehydratase
MLTLNNPADDVLVDAATKGIPAEAAPLRISDIGRQGWNILGGDCPLPIAVIRTDILASNSAWMMAFARLHGLRLAPHGKTTMAPALFSRQLADGAWAITIATTQQMQVCLHAGIRRLILANQPIGQSADACFLALARHPDLELYVLADSLEGVALLADRARRFTGIPALRVRVEVGAVGARTGCRDVVSTIAVARAVVNAPGLILAGVEAFEGVLPDAEAVVALLKLAIESTRALDAQGFFAGDIVISAGGTGFFDLVAMELNSIVLSRPVARVLRSGCYITHDEFGYAHDMERIWRERRVELPEGGLRPALEIWSYVQSRPDPDKALLTMGKRDVGYDNGCPHPVAWYRPGKMRAPAAMPANCIITTLNDQHAHLSIPPTLSLGVGDMVGVGIGHPCTTFERWQLLMLVDAHLNVVGAVRTFF